MEIHRFLIRIDLNLSTDRKLGILNLKNAVDLADFVDFENSEKEAENC